MFKQFKKPKPPLAYIENPAIEIETSICTGEKLIGIRNPVTGKLEQAVLVRNQQDIEQYKREHALDAHSSAKKTFHS